MTAGRYRRVQVDDENLGLGLRAGARRLGRRLDPQPGHARHGLPRGAIGLVRLVTGDRRPPLVLDDPFVTLDDARAERALELLKDISTDFQVIYLTTSDRYDATADAVCVLEGPSAVTGSLSLLPERRRESESEPEA